MTVLGIDRENTEERIRSLLTSKENEKFTFEQKSFEEIINLPKTDVVVSNFSMPFCKKTSFENFWNIVSNSIKDGGYFIGNFFGINDEWNGKKDLTFLTQKEIDSMFKDFEIFSKKEMEYNKKTAMGVMKHWHVIEIFARKKVRN